MMRGSGFRVNKAGYVYGQPLEFRTPTTEALPLYSVGQQGSTAGGNVGLCNTTGIPEFIIMQATTGSQATQIPVLRVLPGVEFIVPCASSETVVSTTNVGNYVAFATSGTAISPDSSGTFAISGVYNTSAANAQFFTGYFKETAPTTA